MNIYKGITNGGANRFWVDKDGNFKVAGADVGGRETYTDINDLLDRAVELFDGTFISGQKEVKYDGSGELGYSVQGADDNIVKFGPSNHSGNTRVEFDDAGDAANFIGFLNSFDDAGFF